MSNAPTFPAYPFADIAAVKRANKMAEQHWFSPDSMRFFSSRIESRLIGGRWFITSETPGDFEPRRFTVREATPAGHIETVGEFRAYGNKLDARAEITRQLAALEANRPTAAPGEYETPARFARRVLAGLTDIPAVPEIDPDGPGTGVSGSEARREYGGKGGKQATVTLADGATFRVFVVEHNTGHARVEFTGRHGFDARHRAALRERAARVLRELLGDGARVLAGSYGHDTFMVQGWSA